MKILVLASWYPPKGGHFFRQQAEALNKLGHTVKVIAQNEYSALEFNGKFINSYEKNGIEVRENKYYRIPKLNDLNEKRFIRKFLKFALAEIVKFKPDIIHAQSSVWAGYVASVIKKKLNIPIVLTEHRGRFLLVNNMGSFIKKHHFPILKRAFNGADKIITVSTALEAGIRQYFPLPDNKFETIPNMVDGQIFEKTSHEKDENLFVFLMVANIEKHKGFDRLIKLVKKLSKKSKKPFVIKVAGKGELLDGLKSKVERNSLENYLQFLGFLEPKELAIEMNKAHSILSLSKFESFGLNIAEGLYCGLPAVVTNSGGPSDFMNDSNGILIKNGSTEALLNAMIDIIENHEKYDNEIIEKNAKEIFHEEVVGGKIENVLKEVLNEQ